MATDPKTEAPVATLRERVLHALALVPGAETTCYIADEPLIGAVLALVEDVRREALREGFDVAEENAYGGDGGYEDPHVDWELAREELEKRIRATIPAEAEPKDPT